MLAAVEPAVQYENLRNYIIGGGRPTDVRALGGDGVRQSLTVPNAPQPNVQTPIPTSSARPGKMTNQRIVYQRVQTHFPKGCGRIDALPVMEGDVVFVHRGDGKSTQGHGHARTSRVATLNQLNRMLASYDHSQPDPADVGDIVMPATTLDENGQVVYPDPRGEPTDAVDPLDDTPKNRWKHCQVLGHWVLDGIVASKEHDCLMDASNPGEVFNITVGGPTITRNNRCGDYPQHFDDGLRALDKLFVGLVATEHRALVGGQYTTIEYYTYQYKLFTSRQLMYADLGPGTIMASRGEAMAAGGDNNLGPTADEFARMVQVWRVGSVTDTNMSMMPYRCATVNVVVEEWELDAVRREFNPYFGESMAFAMEARLSATLAALGILETALAFARANLGVLEGTWSAVGELFDDSVRADVEGWKNVDRMHEEDVELHELRGVPRPPAPGVGPAGAENFYTEPGYNGQRFYLPARERTTAFYTAWTPRAAVRALFRDNLDDIRGVARAATIASDPKIAPTLPVAVRGSFEVLYKFSRLATATAPVMSYGADMREAVVAGRAWPIV